jgi:hypothetical protein
LVGWLAALLVDWWAGRLVLVLVSVSVVSKVERWVLKWVAMLDKLEVANLAAESVVIPVGVLVYLWVSLKVGMLVYQMAVMLVYMTAGQ